MLLNKSVKVLTNILILFHLILEDTVQVQVYTLLEAKAKIEASKKKIEWGSQIRSYVFDDRRVKDHRTGYQTSDVDGVMDGKIDGFIKAYLMEFPTNDEE